MFFCPGANRLRIPVAMNAAVHYIVMQLEKDTMAANALVQTRIDGAVKDEAATVLKKMGLTISDAVRLMLVRVAREKTLPFDVRVPNAGTREAIGELQAGKAARFDDVEALMADLRADD